MELVPIWIISSEIFLKENFTCRFLMTRHFGMWDEQGADLIKVFRKEWVGRLRVPREMGIIIETIVN